MALIALCSAKGSPGVTTTALALAATWPRRVIVAECDPAGGDVLAGYFGGAVEGTRGMAGLISAARRGNLGEQLVQHLVALDETGSKVVLPGMPGPAHTDLGSWWDLLARVFTGLETTGVPADVIADCGRLGAAGSPAGLIRRADAVTVVLRSDLVSVHASRPWLDWLSQSLAANGAAGQVRGVLVVGDRNQYRPAEISTRLGTALVGSIPVDVETAAVFSAGVRAARGFWRSPLIRGAQATGVRLRRMIAEERTRLTMPAPAGEVAARG